MKFSQEDSVISDVVAQNPEMGGFIAFNFDVGKLFGIPSLEGVDLWEVKATPLGDEAASLVAVREKSEAVNAAARQRELNVQLYAQRYLDNQDIFTGDPLEEGEQEWGGTETVEPEAPPQNEEEEWRKFWGGDSPTKRGFNPRPAKIR